MEEIIDFIVKLSFMLGLNDDDSVMLFAFIILLFKMMVAAVIIKAVIALYRYFTK